MAKKMSIYSKEIKGALIMDRDRWGFIQTYDYIPLSEKEYWDFVHKDSKELDRWNKILDSGYISTRDICKSALDIERMKYACPFEITRMKSYYENKLKNAGYYSYTDRNVYKDGSVFWKLSDVEHVFEWILDKINYIIKELTPKQEIWNGKLLSVWYPYSNVRLYVEETRKEKENAEKE